jgi:hypothetical protein
VRHPKTNPVANNVPGISARARGSKGATTTARFTAAEAAAVRPRPQIANRRPVLPISRRYSVTGKLSEPGADDGEDAASLHHPA